MDVIDFLENYWNVFAANPVAFLVFGAVVAGIAIAVTRAVLGGAHEAAKERLAGAREEIERLKGEKGEMLALLERHGEDIEKVKRELESRPRIFASNRPPGPDDKLKDGDLWVTYGEESDRERDPNGT